MVLAYLRREGLILPDYPNGLRSRLREGLILEAISCEALADQHLQQMRVFEALVPILQPSAREEHVNKMVEMLSAAQCYSDLDRKKALGIIRNEARKTAAEVYEILKKYNYWEERPDFTPAQYREIIGRINELKAQEEQKNGSEQDKQ
jgi:hypothetical protein